MNVNEEKLEALKTEAMALNAKIETIEFLQTSLNTIRKLKASLESGGKIWIGDNWNTYISVLPVEIAAEMLSVVFERMGDRLNELLS